MTMFWERLNTIEHVMPSIPRKQTPNPWSSHGKHDRPTPQDKRYWSRAWKSARAAYIKKHPLCVACDDWASAVDHIIPVRAGGDFWNSSNWQSMCAPCHNRKSATERAQYHNHNQHKP